ncbi:L,D-transpeptidase family protein [Lamprobacter modestohalophilus]|uniref:L,D-transpeptidase family protein n=1 Tax=Lamprobacter modestohalophilus TaxID=1064514 RepID=UPI002ADEFB5A|nr:L,D-transpeptidase family protein [Lamprobacter modestohalophilus]MEA1049839.1 L,D-transpeptidase family protein [Lamprobacter modestohalophilus]
MASTALRDLLARSGLTLVGVLGLSASVAAMSVLPGCVVRQAQDGAALAAQRPTPLLADEVLVKKGQRRLYLMRDGKPFRTYRVALGFAPEGHKEREGDGRTPEGRYVLDWRNASSRFTKAINISYPNVEDRARAAMRGDRPGGAIMIHGEPRRHVDPALADLVRYEDWTEGCVAVSNLAIDEIWRYTLDGTPIEIRP